MAKDILIVEPDRRTADTLVLRLSARGYDARSAATVGEAEDAMQRLRPDLMILGLGLPQAAPRHLCDVLRKMQGGALVPILLLDDGGGAVATQREAIALGADRLFRRPAEIATLIETAASLIGPSSQSFEGDEETVDFSSLNALLWSDAPADLAEGQWTPGAVGGSSDDATDISIDEVEDDLGPLTDPPDADFESLPNLPPTDLPSIDFTSLAERSGFDPSAIASADFASLNVILEDSSAAPAPDPVAPSDAPDSAPPADAEGTGFDWGEMPKSTPPPVGPFDSSWSRELMPAPRASGSVSDGPADSQASRSIRSAPPIRRSEPPLEPSVPPAPRAGERPLRQETPTKAGPARPVPVAVPVARPVVPPPAQRRLVPRAQPLSDADADAETPRPRLVPRAQPLSDAEAARSVSLPDPALPRRMLVPRAQALSDSARPADASAPPVDQTTVEPPRRAPQSTPAPRPASTRPAPLSTPAPRPASIRPASLRPEARSAPVSGRPAQPAPAPVSTAAPPPLADRPGAGWMPPAAPLPTDEARWQAVLQPGRSIPLTRRGLGGLLIAVSRLQVSGRVEVTAGGALRRIFFDAGRPVFVDSSAHDEDLGAWLAQEGQITRGTLANARSQAAQLGVPPEEVLIEQGFVTSEAVYRGLALHVADRIIALFGLESGASLLIQGGPRPLDPVDLGMPMERLVLDGVRRKYGRLRLYRSFGTPVTVPRPGRRRADMALRVDEQAALEAVDGQRSVAQIAQAVRMAEPDALAVLHGLALAGYVEPPAAAGAGSLPPLDAALIARADAPRTADLLPGYAEQVHGKLADVNGGDYFAVLDVPPEATGAEIEAAYTTLRRRFDPHRVAGPLAEQVRDIADVLGDAFAILSDPRRRARYAEAIARRRITEAAWQSSKS